MNTEDIIRQYLSEVKKSRSANTVKAYRYSCNDLLEYLMANNKNLFFLSSNSEIQYYIKYLEAKKYSERTVKHRICVLRELISYCISNSYLPDSNRGLNFKVKEKIEYASAEDIKALYKYCSNYDKYDDYFSLRAKTEVMLILLLGFKVGELAELKLEDVSVKNKAVSHYSVIKYIYDRSLIPIINDYISKRSYFISEFDAACDSLFLNRFGKGLKSKAINDDFNKICSEINVNTTLGALRSSCIKYYYDNMPDSLLIAKIFDLSKERLNLMK